MEYLSVAKTAEKCGISQWSVRNYYSEGRIPGAFLTGKTWIIPADAEKPSRAKRKDAAPDTLLNVLKWDLRDFHVRFERLHPFQNGNGRVGRLLLFKECLRYGIMPFIIEPCVDKKDTRQKQRYKILNIEDIKTFQADKREKSLIFQNARPFQKFYAPEMQKHPCNGRSKIALTPKRPYGSQ